VVRIAARKKKKQRAVGIPHQGHTPMTRTPWRARFFRPSIRTSSSLTRFTLMT
jgi:hypothetical protein